MAPRQAVIAVVFSAILASTWLSNHDGALMWLVRLIIACGGVWILGVGLIAGMQIAWHTRRGLAATAEIVSCESAEADHESLLVEGERVVHHPALGDFRDRFLFAAPWTPSLGPGDRLEVLVEPARTRTWFTIAASEPTQPDQTMVSPSRA